MSRRTKSQTVGVVPTMGALHEGHLSLASQSVEECDSTIATIFVNPTQFAPHEDLDRYPRTFDQDCENLRQVGVDAVFAPANEDMYPDGFSTFVTPPEISRSLEGVCRPDHFRGVTTVVLKIFQIIPATHAYFGKKDFQQLRVIQAMARDLNVAVEIIGCEIVRESDGLAMSSRNRYLSAEERSRSLKLSQALRAAAQQINDGQNDTTEIESTMRRVLIGADDPDEQGVNKIDYACIVKSRQLTPVGHLKPGQSLVALIAAHVGKTRLIDNLEIEVPSRS